MREGRVSIGAASSRLVTVFESDLYPSDDTIVSGYQATSAQYGSACVT